MKSLNALQPFTLLALRVALGVIFFAHGYPKVTHLGSSGMQSFFVEHGLPGYFVYVSGTLEVFGGALLMLGLFARPVALLLSMEMAVAIWKVHSGKGYLAVHEYEFPLALAAACLALASVGAGAFSVDGILFERGGSRASKS